MLDGMKSHCEGTEDGKDEGMKREEEEDEFVKCERKRRSRRSTKTKQLQ